MLTIKKDVYTDLFLVGGGGGGAQNGQLSALCNGGGGGGYTKTVLNTLLRKGTYNIVIGAGGTGGSTKTGASPTDGGTTSITGSDGFFTASRVENTHQPVPGQVATAALAVVVAAMRIVSDVHLAGAVVLMVLPVPMAVAQAEPDRAQLQGSLARLPGNCIPAAAAVALHTTRI